MWLQIFVKKISLIKKDAPVIIQQIISILKKKLFASFSVEKKQNLAPSFNAVLRNRRVARPYQVSRKVFVTFLAIAAADNCGFWAWGPFFWDYLCNGRHRWFDSKTKLAPLQSSLAAKYRKILKQQAVGWYLKSFIRLYCVLVYISLLVCFRFFFSCA